MYMVRFDGAAETWATKLSDSSATRPPYGMSPTDSTRTTFIWSWYGHHGRIAYDGVHWAAYYGSSLSGSSQTLTRSNCAQADSTQMVGIDVHQGDQMRLVDATGAIQMGGFDWGCSHSYYERITYDATAKKFVQICETDASNQLLIAPPSYTGAKAIYAIDMQRELGNYSNIGNLVTGTQGGYWVTVSKSRASAAGMADVQTSQPLRPIASSTFRPTARPAVTPKVARTRSPSTATATTSSETILTAASPIRRSARATPRSRSCGFCPAGDP